MGNFVSHPLFHQAASTAVQVREGVHKGVAAHSVFVCRVFVCLTVRRSGSPCTAVYFVYIPCASAACLASPYSAQPSPSPLVAPHLSHCCTAIIQGHAFVWEKDTVQISHQQRSVLFTGRWAANGERYNILMRPGGSSSSDKTIRRPPLQVGAQLLAADGSVVNTDVKGELCGLCCDFCRLVAARVRFN